MANTIRTAIFSLMVMLITGDALSQNKQRALHYYPTNMEVAIKKIDTKQRMKETELNRATESSVIANYRQRVWETISKLPMSTDWRYEDARDKFFEKWRTGIFTTLIIYTDEDTVMGDSPGQYYPPSLEMIKRNDSLVEAETELGRIHVNPLFFSETDDKQKVIEHELYHAAFRSASYIPGWMLYLGNNTDINEPYNGVERVVMALTSRRSVLDYHKLPLESFLTLEQIDAYITSKLLTGLDTGFKILVKSTTPENLVKLLNFVNGYELNCNKAGTEL